MYEELYGDSEEYEAKIDRYDRTEQYDKAYTWLSDLLKIYPDDFIILADMSRICMLLGKVDEALLHSAHAYNLDKTSWTFYHYAQAMIDNNLYMKTISAVEDFEKEYPDEVETSDFYDALFLKGEALIILRQYDEARNVFVRCMAHYDEEMSRFDKELLMKMFSFVKQAKIHIGESDADDNPMEGAMSKTDLIQFENDYEGFRMRNDDNGLYAWLLEKKKLFPNAFSIDQRLAETCTRIGKLEEGLKYARTAYEHFPEDNLCLDTLMELLWLNECDEETIEMADRIIDHYHEAAEDDDIFNPNLLRELAADAFFFKASSQFNTGHIDDAKVTFAEFKRFIDEGIRSNINPEEIEHLEMMLALLGDTFAN
ncbi:MAG: hypothetical protein J5784_05675 [Muribaculaceae bacterium]|nr:hypothetical protein [Muribaculaceae bacterium]